MDRICASYLHFHRRGQRGKALADAIAYDASVKLEHLAGHVMELLSLAVAGELDPTRDAINERASDVLDELMDLPEMALDVLLLIPPTLAAPDMPDIPDDAASLEELLAILHPLLLALALLVRSGMDRKAESQPVPAILIDTVIELVDRSCAALDNALEDADDGRFGSTLGLPPLG